MIFIVGNSRSGTTMMGRILGLHSKVHTFGELHFFEQLVDAEELRPDTSWQRDKLVKLVERLLTRARDGFFAEFKSGTYRGDAETIVDSAVPSSPAVVYAAFMAHEAQRNGKLVPCEQTPRYLFFADEILRIYPNARIINMIRDPRDVVLSQRSKWKRRFLGGSGIPLREAIRAWSNYHPWLVCRLWVSCVDHAMAMRSDRFMSVRFEDLLAEPEREVRTLCRFLGLDFEPEMLSAPQVGSSSGRDDPDKRGINKDRAGGWRKFGISPTLRTLCEWVCHDRMRRVGYDEFLNDGRFSPRMILQLLSLPGKMFLALTFNLTRFRRLYSSLQRRVSAKGGKASW